MLDWRPGGALFKGGMFPAWSDFLQIDGMQSAPKSQQERMLLLVFPVLYSKEQRDTGRDLALTPRREKKYHAIV